MSELLSSLRVVVGDDHVLTDPGDVASYDTDWRGAYSGRPLAVIRPASTAEVAEVLRLTHDAGVAVVPQGGNTGMAGGAVPDDSGSQVILSLTRMRAIRDIDPVGGTITVEAGVVLAAVQEAAAGVDRLFPLSLGSGGSCTIGGNIATNAGGTAVLRYGMTRSLVLGLEVVLPDGRVWDGLRSLRKDNTGYDLKQLFIGAEGTLGIVTAAVLTLHPATPSRATAWLALRDVAAAAELLGVLREHAGERLTTWELVSRPARDLSVAAGVSDPLASDAEWFGLVELAGPAGADVDAALEAALGGAVETGLVVDAAIASSPAQRSGLWALRERVSEAQESIGPTVKHDVSVPITGLADFVARSRPGRRGTAARHSAGRLRPRRGRQPALQPEPAAGPVGRGVPGRRSGAQRGGQRVGGNGRREHQCRARAGPGEGGGRGVVQERGRGGPHAHAQGRPRSRRVDEPRQGPAPTLTR